MENEIEQREKIEEVFGELEQAALAVSDDCDARQFVGLVRLDDGTPCVFVDGLDLDRWLEQAVALLADASKCAIVGSVRFVQNPPDDEGPEGPESKPAGRLRVVQP